MLDALVRLVHRAGPTGYFPCSWQGPVMLSTSRAARSAGSAHATAADLPLSGGSAWSASGRGASASGSSRLSARRGPRPARGAERGVPRGGARRARGHGQSPAGSRCARRWADAHWCGSAAAAAGRACPRCSCHLGPTTGRALPAAADVRGGELADSRPVWLHASPGLRTGSLTIEAPLRRDLLPLSPARRAARRARAPRSFERLGGYVAPAGR